MKNGEYLTGKNLLDVLCELSDGMKYSCIMRTLTDGCDERCERFENCEQCIAAWLDEERNS